MAIVMTQLTAKQLENLAKGRQAAREASAKRAGAKVERAGGDFGAWLRTRLAQLEAQDKHLENTERGIGEQRRALAAQIVEVRSALDLFGAWRPGAVHGAEASKADTNVSDDILKRVRSMTIAGGAAEIIRARGEATIREIAP